MLIVFCMLLLPSLLLKYFLSTRRTGLFLVAHVNAFSSVMYVMFYVIYAAFGDRLTVLILFVFFILKLHLLFR